MKKLIALLFVLSCMTMGCFALEEGSDVSIDLVNPKTAATAYMDIQKASPALREEILAARNEIIFHNSWVVDGYSATLTTTDGTVEVLPLFSSLFPGWDVPSSPAQRGLVHEIISLPPIIVPLAGGRWVSASYNHYLNAASSSNAQEFATIQRVPPA